jgi:ABC-type nitrate/sulfonate/bicarbonate transport system permease component
MKTGRRIWLVRSFLIMGGLALWEGIVRLGMVNPRLLPPPTLIFTTLGSLIQAGKFGTHVWITCLEVMTAFILSVPLGITAGILLAKHVYFEKVFGSFVYFLVSIPKSIFLPIFILTLGIGFYQKVAFGVAQAFFVVAVNSTYAVASVPQQLVLLGKSCGANTWQLYTRIYIPAMIPIVLEGIRLGMIFNITGVILAEMYAAKSGIGFLISSWADTFQMPHLFAGITVATVISIVVNETIRFYEKRVSRWRV